MADAQRRIREEGILLGFFFLSSNYEKRDEVIDITLQDMDAWMMYGWTHGARPSPAATFAKKSRQLQCTHRTWTALGQV